MNKILIFLFFSSSLFSQGCFTNENFTPIGRGAAIEGNSRNYSMYKINPITLYGISGEDLKTYLPNITTAEIITDTGIASRDGDELVINQTTGTYTMTLSNFFYRCDYDIDIIDQNAGIGVTRNVIMIGNSLTSPGTIANRLFNRFSTDVMAIDLVGTQGTTPNETEGHSGRSYDWFWSDPSSPFVFSSMFDFSQYLSTNSFSFGAEDWVIFQLGTNDIGLSGDCQARYNTAKTAIDGMVSNIHSYNSDINIGVALVHESAYQLYAWEDDYSPDADLKKEHWQSCQIKWNKWLIEDYEFSNVDLIPIHYALDGKNDYPVDGMGNQINALHPIPGYPKIGDYYYYFIKSRE